MTEEIEALRELEAAVRRLLEAVDGRPIEKALDGDALVKERLSDVKEKLHRIDCIDGNDFTEAD